MKKTALMNGIELCLIDSELPLKEQGPFDAIIHKLRPNEGECVPALQFFGRTRQDTRQTRPLTTNKGGESIIPRTPLLAQHRLGKEFAGLQPGASGRDGD